MEEQTPKQNKKLQHNEFLRYSSMATQMGVTVVGLTYLGIWLDEKVENETPWFTAFLAVFSVIIAVYNAIKGLIK